MDNKRRVESSIETRTGRCFDFANPQKEDVAIQDIATSLAKQCRFNGHTSRFYSIAEHSVLLSRHLEGINNRAIHARRTDCPPEQLPYSAEERLLALLHDASEAYMGGLVKPLKQMMPDFVILEAKVHAVIMECFGLPMFLPEWLLDLDFRILKDERSQAMSPSGNRWAIDDLKPLGVQCLFWAPEQAERQFMAEFERICAQMSVKN